MKKQIIFILALFVSTALFSQSPVGSWNGLLKVQGQQIRLVINIQQEENGYKATMDSPDQGAKGIPVDQVTFVNDTLKFEVKMIGVTYAGLMGNDQIIKGTFTQMGMSLPLDLSTIEVKKDKVLRPQEPKAPFPYYSEEVKFFNKIDGDTLAGTLTLPDKKGKFPVVVLISGSGPQNRDEELMGHKPFLVIADFLTRNGIAVLRYDDRGTAQSTGDFQKATSTDLANDAEAAVNFLLARKDINIKKIGLAGHSEGGMIAPMVAARNPKVAFIVLLAGPGLRGKELLELQTGAIAKASGMSDAELAKVLKLNSGAYDLVLHTNDTTKLRTDLTDYLLTTLKDDPTLGENPTQEQLDMKAKAYTVQLSSPWMQYFIKYDPIPTLKKVKCPVLALNGSKDLQVPAKENLAAIRKAFQQSGNKKLTAIELPDLNHLFQQCTTGAPSEYATIEQTFSPTALEEILKWLKKR